MKEKSLEGTPEPIYREALQKVLYWFFAYPNKEMSLNDLVEELEISKTTANKIVEGLIEEGFLHREVLGRTWRISCNQQHHYNRTLKIPYNLSIISGSGVVDFIKEKFPGSRAIVLFGSYRKGDDTEESDLDMAVEVVDDEEPEIISLGKLDWLGYRKDVPVNLHVFSRNHIDLNLFNNIANGIVLDGFLEVGP